MLWIPLVFGIVDTVIGTMCGCSRFRSVILTLGLILLVINAAMLSLTAALVDSLSIDGFGWAFLGSILISLIAAIAERCFPARAKANCCGTLNRSADLDTDIHGNRVSGAGAVLDGSGFASYSGSTEVETAPDRTAGPGDKFGVVYQRFAPEPADRSEPRFSTHRCPEVAVDAELRGPSCSARQPRHLGATVRCTMLVLPPLAAS